MSEEKKNTQIEVVATEVSQSTGINADQFDRSKNQELVHIPFKKSWSLFWSNKNPSKKPKKAFYFWYPPGQSAYEKRLVFKIDMAIMSYVCLSYFVRYLDAQNISSAYVSGMKEDLNLHGTDYNWLSNLFGAAYSLAGPFSNLAISKVKIHHILPTLEILWGLMCLLVYRAKDFKTVAALRFVQGLCEGAAWPAIHYTLGSWYTPEELGKRVSIFTAAGILGTLLSGLIQSALKATADGVGGLAGWRWLFIVDGIITFPIAVYGFFIFPDVPNNATARWFLSEDDIQFCRERVKVNGKHRVDKFDKTVLKRVFTSYNWYLFVVLWVLWGFACTGNDYFSIVLEDLGYNVYDRNNIPTIGKGVMIVTCIFSGFVIDWRGGTRWEVSTVGCCVWILANALVYAWDIPRGALIFGYTMQAMSGVMSPLIVGWCNELAKDDDQLRALTVGSLNFFSGLICIPWTVYLFNTDFGPRFEKGNRATLIVTVILTGYMFLVLQFDRYQNRKRDYIKELTNDIGEVSAIVDDEESEVRTIKEKKAADIS